VDVMLKIAICDQSHENCRKTADVLTKILFDEMEVCYFFYESSMEIIDDILAQKFEADLLFIDVILPGINGLKTVEYMRKQGIQTDIIFLTEAAEFATEGYRLHAFDYLIKPVPISRFEQTMQRYMEEKFYIQEDFLNVNIRGCNRKINLQRVLFFESSERKVIAVTADEEIVFYQKLNRLQEQLDGTRFLRCHQSYIVNTAYVALVSSTDITLLNKKKIPISKRYSKEIREYLSRQQTESI
jgi:DNA-binding LytR/AlgR family response regulator